MRSQVLYRAAQGRASHYVDAEGRSLFFGVTTTRACQVTDLTLFCALTDQAECCV